jgi:hypothetical protein
MAKFDVNFSISLSEKSKFGVLKSPKNAQSSTVFICNDLIITSENCFQLAKNRFYYFVSNKKIYVIACKLLVRLHIVQK